MYILSYLVKLFLWGRKKNQRLRWFPLYRPDCQLAFCDPGGIRTHDPQLRRLLLYPTELLDPFWGCKISKI